MDKERYTSAIAWLRQCLAKLYEVHEPMHPHAECKHCEARYCLDVTSGIAPEDE